ncbi:hypothetical protein HYS54_00595, partial [Candidatus Micrarchaeota archaeon]|nr:hypothetical protein [Candidatus Micrarchaeota archaeon]
VGIYSAAFRVFAFIVMFPITLENVLLPTLSGLFHESRRKMEAVYFRAVKYNLLLSAGLAVVAFFAAPALVDLLFPKYSQAIIVFDVMLLALIVYGFGSGQRSIFFAFKAQRQFFYSFLFTLAITFAAGIPASIMWNGVGMAGVFVSTLVLATALRSYYIAKLDRRFRVRFHELLRVDEFDRKLLARAWQKVLHRQQPPDEAVRP